MELLTIGIDLGKKVFHLVGLNQRSEAEVLVFAMAYSCCGLNLRLRDSGLLFPFHRLLGRIRLYFSTGIGTQPSRDDLLPTRI